MRLLIALLLILTAGLVQADCAGRDLRDHLTPHGKALLRQTIAETPYAVGNHWIARKAGRQVHIIGTMHDGDLRMTRIMTRLRPVIRSADVVFLEVTAQASDAHIDKVWRNPSVFLRDAPPYLPDLLSDAAWATLSDQLAAEDFNPEVVARMQPWFAGFFLDTSRCGGGFGAGLGLDDRLERAARAANVAIRSLEPPGAALSAVSSQPLADQVLMLEWDLTTRQSLDDQIVTTANSYFDERLAEGLWIQTQTLYSDLDLPRSQITRVLDGFYRRLIDDRNRIWLPVIDRAQGPIVVVAVGGAHLPGQAGLLNLLAARGYTLERAPF